MGVARVPHLPINISLARNPRYDWPMNDIEEEPGMPWDGHVVAIRPRLHAAPRRDSRARGRARGSEAGDLAQERP